MEHTVWKNISSDLSQRHPLSVMLIQRKMKETLGFCVRQYSYFDEREHLHKYKIALDFYDEKKKTMFLMTYGHYIK